MMRKSLLVWTKKLSSESSYFRSFQTSKSHAERSRRIKTGYIVSDNPIRFKGEWLSLPPLKIHPAESTLPTPKNTLRNPPPVENTPPPPSRKINPAENISPPLENAIGK